MKPHIVSLLRIGKRVAVLGILIIAVLTLRPVARELNAQSFPPDRLPDIGVSGFSCFSGCDATYWNCMQSCCRCTDYTCLQWNVNDPTKCDAGFCNTQWDCSSCPECGQN